MKRKIVILIISFAIVISCVMGVNYIGVEGLTTGINGVTLDEMDSLSNWTVYDDCNIVLKYRIKFLEREL